MTRTPIMSGQFSEQSLTDLLEGMSLCRQYVGIELWDSQGAEHGSLLMKSGHLLGAQRGGEQGRRAIERILLDPGASFLVYRTDKAPVAGLASLGRLDEVVSEVMAVGNTRATPPTKPPPAPDENSVSVTSVRVAPAAHSAARAMTPEPAPPSPPPPPARPAEPRPVEARRQAEPSADDRAPAARGRATEPRATKTFSKASQGRDRRARAIAEGEGVGVPVIAVVGNKGGVGKTTVALNLAVAMARRGIKTILVDADPRGDVAVALAASRDTSVGLYDVLASRARIDEALLWTRLSTLGVLPAGGDHLDEEALHDALGRSDRMAAVLSALSGRAGCVVVDTPAGLRGVTRRVLSGATHVLGVVQAEPVALRSAGQLLEVLEGIEPSSRPALVGVLLNMLDRRVGASVSTLEQACEVFGAEQLLDVTIPRAAAFVEASSTGTPVAMLDPERAPSVGFIFESVASAVLAKVGLVTPSFSAEEGLL